MNAFSIISTKENVSNVKKWKRLIPKKLYLYYIQKKIPVSINEIEYIGEKGQEIVLPFTLEELETLEEDYVRRFLEIIEVKNGIEYLFVAPQLRKRLYRHEDSLLSSYKTVLQYIMFPQVLEQVLKDSKINKKDMRLVIIDSGDLKIEFILKLVICELNYLTIITKRPEYFDEFVDTIYDTTGLLVEVNAESDVQEITGNVIIDLSNQYRNYYTSTAVVLDMQSSLLKRQYQYSRKKDMKLIYDTLFYSGNQLVNNELLSFLLFSNHLIVREFLEDKNRDYLESGITEIGRILNLKVVKLIYL